ncbi:MAG: GNAT family N-acetyltransferase [Actinomycetota bacterium]|nr:GNAT family N-acetyltransferase [Actinomycetota bacterium]
MGDAAKVEIAALDPGTASPEELDAWCGVASAATVEDLPDDPQLPPSVVIARLRNPPPGERQRSWLARLEGAAAGICTLSLPDAPNKALAYVEMQATPALRRRGVGTALLSTAVGEAVAHGRTTIGTEVLAGMAGAAFAEALGFSCGLREHRRLLAIGDLDMVALVQIVDGTPPGYRLARWSQRVPDEFIDAYAAAKAAMADAPTGDLQWRAETYDAIRWREMEAAMERRNNELRIVVALTQPGGKVAAFTELTVSRDAPRRATQEDTAVVLAHRGHGLGLIVKAELLRWLLSERHDVIDIETWNADSNAHMIAVNERLGFRLDVAWLEYEAPADALAERLGTTAGCPVRP